jgi:hypothetical protein
MVRQSDVGNLRARGRGAAHTAADVVAKVHAVLTEAELLQAMFHVGYFPPNTPPPRD